MAAAGGGGGSGGSSGGSGGGGGGGGGDEGKPEKKPVFGWKGWQDRVAADPQFVYKVVIEQVGAARGCGTQPGQPHPACRRHSLALVCTLPPPARLSAAGLPAPRGCSPL